MNVFWVTRRLSPKPGRRRDALSILRNLDVPALALRFPGCLAADLRPADDASGDLLLVSCWHDGPSYDQWPTTADPHLLHVLEAVLDPLLQVPFMTSPVLRSRDEPPAPD